MQTEFNDYNIIKLERDTVKDLVYIFEAAYGVRPSEDDLANKHIYCHGPAKFVGFIAYHKESKEPAAYYGVFPTFVCYEGKQRLVAQSGDTMTHPSHQKKGLFIQLAKVTFEYCTTVGIELIFGFPNKNSYPGFMKHLNFTELPTLVSINFLENRFELNRFTTGRAKASAIHASYLKFILSLFSKSGSIFSNSNKHTAVYTVHDDLYYKLKGTPTNKIVNIGGINVFLSLAGNQLMIGDIDLDAQNINRLTDVVRRLKIITVLSGCRYLSIGGTGNSFLISYLLEKGYKSTPSYKLIFRDLSSGIPFDLFTFLNCDVDVF